MKIRQTRIDVRKNNVLFFRFRIRLRKFIFQSVKSWKPIQLKNWKLHQQQGINNLKILLMY